MEKKQKQFETAEFCNIFVAVIRFIHIFFYNFFSLLFVYFFIFWRNITGGKKPNQNTEDLGSY